MKSKNESLISKHAKSFSWAGFFLPKKIFIKCSHLYDFCRTLDDIADSIEDLEIKRKKFLSFKKDFSNKNYSNEIIKNIHILIDDNNISDKIIYDLFDGVETDLKDEVKINSKKELIIYSYRVAGTVGLIMAKILNVKDYVIHL
jgi:phytoene synthase